MSRLTVALLIGGAFMWASLIGFVVAVIVVGGRKRRPKPPAPAVTGTLHERMVPRPRVTADPEWAYDFDGPLMRAGADRQAARLAAELDDPAAVDRWLGGAS